MRKVKSQSNHHHNPLAMFADGIEQIVREKSIEPTRYDDYELKEIQRKEQFMPQQANRIHVLLCKLSVVELLRNLFWTRKQASIG